MRRTPSSGESQAVSLFPFLAVLLSTMGALVLVLVVMAHQARLQAAHREGAGENPAPAEEPDADAQAEQDTGIDTEKLQKQAARLEAIHQAGLTELKESRLRLRHADQHLRQLQDEVAALYQEVQSLEEMDSHRLEDRQQARRELARLQQLIRETEARLAEQRRKMEASPKSYAIVPYEGPHGTQRRPFYIECRRDVVVLQPEGIELRFEDFQGPLGPGNPLASALRAAEEYYASNSSGDGEEQPYPLVLVRPEGIAAYYYVRKALEGWGSDFGYELLDGDWQLEFPLPNPQVANVQQRAIDLARARQQALAMAAPRRYAGGGGRAQGDAAGGGGFNQGLPSGLTPGLPGNGEDGSGTDAEGDRRVGSDRYATERRQGKANGHSTAAAQRAAYGENGSAGRGGPVGQGQSGDQTYDGASGQGRSGRDAGNNDSERFPGTTPLGAQASRSAAGGHSGTVVSAANRSPGLHDDGPAAQGSLESGSSGGTAAGGAPPSGSLSQQLASGSRPPAGADARTTAVSSARANIGVRPLAATRGANWALPKAGLGMVPVRRAIHVVIRQDRLAILPEPGARAGKTIPVADSLQRAVDPFVDAVTEHVEAWGTAGKGLYWQPMLVLKSGPDGAHHAAALQRLLEGSGLDIAPPPPQGSTQP